MDDGKNLGEKWNKHGALILYWLDSKCGGRYGLVLSWFKFVCKGSTERNCCSELKSNEKVRNSYWFRHTESLGRMGKCTPGTEFNKRKKHFT